MSNPVSSWVHPIMGRVWRSHCDACSWDSRDLPFPDPDAALHGLTLHGAVCRGTGSPSASTVEVVRIERAPKDQGQS